MSSRAEAIRVLEEWGKELSIDLQKSLVKALRDGGNKNVQNPALNFNEQIDLDGAGVTLGIYASGEYWKWIESGRKKGERRIPADVVGKRWQNLNGIDPREALVRIRIKSKKGITYNKNKLNYDKAAKSLSFVIQGSIFKKGIKPKPFVDRVLEDGRIEELSLKLRQVLGPAYKLEIVSFNGSN